MRAFGHKGLVIPLIVAIVAVLAAGSAYFVWEKGKAGQANQESSQTSASTAWQTYTNNQYGFTFLYPSDWKVVDESAETENPSFIIQSPELHQYLKDHPNATGGPKYDIYIGIHGYKNLAYNPESMNKTSINGMYALFSSTSGDGASNSYIVDRKPYTYVLTYLLPKTDVKTKIFNSIKFTN